MQDSKFGEYLYLTPRVPQGLAAAVEGLTREVIRHRPENIYAFAARRFENLLRLREQYDVEPSSSNKKSSSSKHLHEVNEAVRERYDEPTTKDTNAAKDDHAKQSGWSLNETAKVLEKHRSIFGDSGQKVSTEQIRELANEPVLTSRDVSPKRKVDRLNEENLKCIPGSSRRKDESTAACVAQHHEASIKNGAQRNAPRILSQIPIAKDIKTELKRNRISSRERKKVVACEYTRETIIEKSSKKSVEKTRKSYELRSERKSSTRTTEDSSSMRKRTTSVEERTKSRAANNSHQGDKRFTRGGSMDSVKNYVVQNFVGMTSLDELQSPSYVEKVQEVIDETSSVIKQKVEALRSGVTRAAKAKQTMKKNASLSSEDHSNKSSNGEKREPSLSRRNSNKASLDQQDVSEASDSKSSLPAVRPLSSKSSTSRSMSARSDSDVAALTLPPISPESAKSPKVKDELVILPVLSPPCADVSPEDADDTTAAVDDIAEDVTVSSDKIVEDKVIGETVPSEEMGEEQIVPSEETADDKAVTAVKNSVAPEEKIDDEEKTETVAEKTVPSDEKLVPPKETMENEKAVPHLEIDDGKAVSPIEINHEKEVTDDKTTISEENNEAIITNKGEKRSEVKASTDHLLVVKEEEFHDSLNVTPEPFDTKGQRPDSLENSQAEDNKSADDGSSSGHVSPLETLKDKLLEIEEVQKRIEDVLDDTKTSKDAVEGKTSYEASTTTTGIKIEDKLIEIQESEKRIEQILDSQTTIETLNSDIKNKLQELEEAERRIESIFTGETIKESCDVQETVVIDIKESTAVTNLEESKEQTVSEHLSVSTINKIDQDTSDKIETPSTRAVSPHSYILTEGSPYEIPDTVTTVIIPERTPSADSETLRVEVEDDGKILVTTTSTTSGKASETQQQRSNSMSDAFGEAIETTSEHSEPSTVDIEYIRGIKASHDMIVSRENLDRIREERDEVDVIDSEDEKVLKVVTSSLEEILEKEQVEYVQVQQLVSRSTTIEEKTEEEEKHEESSSIVEVAENSLESTARSGESTNEVKETSVTTTDRSSLSSLDPAMPAVPELNLDSLADLTISSFNASEKDSSLSKKENDGDSLDVAMAIIAKTTETAETQEFEKLEERLQQPTAASDIGVPVAETAVAAVADINNVVCSDIQEEKEAKDISDENNPLPPPAASQCTVSETTVAIDSIDANERESVVADHDVNNDNDNDDHADEKKAYHIYVPEANGSKDVSTSSETSTFMSAATKIQAGVRGFLARRRLQSTQKRSSTLDSVPSIQESFAIEGSSALMPIVETTITSSSMSEAKARKKLRREDAVQRTTLSVENAFADNQLQHTGEFHDCIPLPLFDAEALSMKSISERRNEAAAAAAAAVNNKKVAANEVEQLLEKILLGHAATNFDAHPKLVDVVLLPTTVSTTDSSELQNKYLNFITSVEDVFGELPETPKGVIIEEITTSLEETTTSDIRNKDIVEKSTYNDAEELTLASISTSEDPLSINIEEVLGLDEDQVSSRRNNKSNDHRLDVVKLSVVDQIRSSNVSQDSPISDERTRSPVTMMMQIGVDKSVDDKSVEENPT